MARVLHIEDDPHSRRLVSKLLLRAGHEVFETESGLEGIRMARRVQPELVLVDINVPDLDGYEVTLRLRSMRELDGVPIVAITAEGDRQTSLAVGASGFLTKPIDARRFADVVAGFLRGHRESADETGETKLREQSHRIVEHLERKVGELATANERLEELARLRREFLQNVSHELATPMTPVVGYLKLLLDEELGPLTDLQRKCLVSIERSTRRLRSVTDTLLDVSALESGRMHYYDRPYDFADVARRALAQVRETLPEDRLQWVVGTLESPMASRGDPDKLRRAIVHVLDNASKFTPRGGTVAVETRTRDGWHELLVADDGPGIAPSAQERIFEPFYQVDGSVTRAHGGVGLGLAFARRVTEALGGSIDLASPPNEAVAGATLPGTLLRLRIPRSDP
ncbi:MAG: hybrid sensor histidine kinase/response regulator [Sandaracinus sp.]|nr:hybrid sensor histidine kinase/response regulator [Sandaracinus sp.]